MTEHIAILKTMAVDDLAPQGARASAAREQYTQDRSVNRVYISIDIF